ncbi:MAG: hypothetical protein H7A21_06165 [Spirochaetales bacterium]|nr:hypothetical protein [Leptospiraceae bacterium]MCP5480996.1 hypothetical protein [Spirochaetales bacterium]MCP5485376.1 hypothetical protein [Spirochaetales bacterium]
MAMEMTLRLLEATSYLAAILGIPVAIYVYVYQKNKDRVERELETFLQIDHKYIEYLKLCIDNPRLDLYYLPLNRKVSLSAEEKIRQLAQFEILVSLLECTYFLYKDQASPIKKSQWEGWDSYIDDWCRRKIFRDLWKKVGHQFESGFCSVINNKLERSDLRPPASR